MQPQDAESPDSRCSGITTDDSDDEQDHAASLSDGLRNWAVHYGITLVALTALLTLLRAQHPFLPKDGRTLLRTRRSVIIDSRASGSYYHFGLLTNVLSALDKMRCFLPDGSTVNIQLNIDGLPLFKSSSLQFWPVLGILKGLNVEPFVISLFCGYGKPSSLAEYLSPVIQEINQLKNGFQHKSKQIFLNVCSVICDAPARAFVKAVKSHSGYNGCDKCCQSCYSVTLITA
jgi:hypothetical protein